ncbi:MAG: TonB-dependent receptor [Bacteroidota bacterium]|nr:TonB-dependent receptor [Bacteroidota bacterium]
MRQFLVVIFWIIGFSAIAQNGIIRGTIYDESTGETLVGVNVLLKGTSTGTVSDLDGEFSIETEKGSYDLQLSYISYQTLLIQDLKVVPNEVTLLENIYIKESALELTEVVITAEAARSSETALLTIKKKSTAILDGISASRIKLTGDATAVDAAKRVTGVSVEDGKYVYVRGLGDRYTKTTLNQVDIPGLDPDRNSLQMDIFPTNLIDNIIVKKNFTAEMPADFTGGILNVETKDFPDRKISSFSLGIGYNPQSNLNEDYLTYDGSSTDFLGFDGGTRALPEGAASANIPTPISGASVEEVSKFIKSFNPELAAKKQRSFLDFSFGFSLGDQKTLKTEKAIKKEARLGYTFSLSYKQDYQFYDDVIYGEYQRYIDPDRYELRYATIQNGQLGENEVLLGLLGGVAYKTKRSKYKINLLRLQSGTSRAGKFFIDNDGEAVGQSGYLASSDNLEYNERSLSNLLISGTHILNDPSWLIDWRISPTFSSSNDPDIRKTAFTFSAIDTTFMAGAGGNPTRIWRTLMELNTTAKVDITKELTLMNNDAKIKFGVNHNFKYRDYEILFFDVQFFANQSWPNPSPDKVLDPANIYPNKPNSIYYQSGNPDPNPNAYKSNVNNLAGYASVEFLPLPLLKTILGLRIENYVQRYTGRDQTYASGDIKNGKNLDNAIVLDATDLFPSINLIYSISNEMNLRGGYAQTIARPSFKELSFAQILDPISNRIFNGSLFTYPNWDGNLTETRIDNFDLRWEWYAKRGQMLSFSSFYKSFDDPIELVRIPEQQTSTEYQPRNVGDGQLYGLEFEFNKDFGFITKTLEKLNLYGNFTYVYSIINMTETEYNSRKTYEKTGETIKDTREMAGQSPYVINLGITYRDIDNGVSTGFFYNVKGSTLYIVGGGLFPDIYIEPFNSLNFSFNKSIGKNNKTNIDFKISNLLAEKMHSYYKSFGAEDKLFHSLNPGRTFTISLSHRF